MSTVVFDLDGTLVDSVPFHVLAWQAAFDEVGLQVPSHLIRRHIGQGGDRLVSEVAGEECERRHGDRLRARHPELVSPMVEKIQPTPGAEDLLAWLGAGGHRCVLASSGGAELTGRLLARFSPRADTLFEAVFTGDDAEETKPDGALVQLALGGASASAAIAVGDSI